MVEHVLTSMVKPMPETNVCIVLSPDDQFLLYIFNALTSALPSQSKEMVFHSQDCNIDSFRSLENRKLQDGMADDDNQTTHVLAPKSLKTESMKADIIEAAAIRLARNV